MTATEMRLMVYASPVVQADVAKHMEMDAAILSKILNSRRPMPEGFETKFLEAFEAAKAEMRSRL